MTMLPNHVRPLRSGWEHAVITLDGTAHHGYRFEPAVLARVEHELFVIPQGARLYRWYLRRRVGDRICTLEGSGTLDGAMAAAERQLTAVSPMVMSQLCRTMTDTAVRISTDKLLEREPACPRCAALQAEVEQLQARLAELQSPPR